MSDQQPGIGSVFSGASNVISMAAAKASTSKAATAIKGTPIHSLVVSVIVVAILIIGLGIGRGAAEGYCETVSTNQDKRAGRSVTAVEDSMFMILGFAILLPLGIMQGSHLFKNRTAAPLQLASWGSWMAVTLTMLIVWIVATAQYWSVEDKEEGRGKAVNTVFHVAVIIVIGILALVGSGTAVYARA